MSQGRLWKLEYPVHCRWCPEEFEDMRDLLLHAQAEHPAEYQAAVRRCGDRYARRGKPRQP